MIGGGVGKRYARAIHELATEQRKVEPIGESLDDLAATWKSSDELREVFENPRFSVQQKRDIIRSLAEKVGADPVVRSTVQMLSDRRRLRHLPEIAATYRRLTELQKGRVRAEIVSATELPDRFYGELERALNLATGKQVELVRRQDPSLIGGVVTTVGGRVYDGSLLNRLRELRSQLLASTDPVAMAKSD